MSRVSQRYFTSCRCRILCGLLLTPTGMVMAQQEEPEMIITANKAAQRIEDVAASVTTLYGSALREAKVTDLEQLARLTPGFTFQPFGQSGTQLPVMRGLSSGATAFSTAVLLQVDGVPTLMGQGFEHNLLGVSQVDILRGPQSTLYGRNAEAGVINITTRQPDDLPYLQADAAYGSRNKRNLRVDASTPLIENQLYLGVAGEWNKQEGFIDNTYRERREDDRESRNGRLTLRWTPDDVTDASLRYSQQNYHDGASLWGAVNAENREVRSGTDSWNRSWGRSLSLDVSRELSPDLRLGSITAQTDFYDRVQQDTDFLPADMFHLARDYHLRQQSQELRLEGKWRDSQWLAGVYVDRNDNQLNYQQKTPLALTSLDSATGGNSQAVFGQWMQPLDERWSLTLGMRGERDNVHITPSGEERRSQTWQRMTPKASLQYAWQSDAQIYASFSQGFRAGGFNAFSPVAGYPGYAPEKVNSYEVGAKGWAANQRLHYTVAFYHMDIRDMQVQQIIQPGLVYITNAASAQSDGVDIQATYLLTERWTLDAALGINRTRFDEFSENGNNYQGNRNPFAPDLSGNISLRYDNPAGWYALASFSGVGKTYLDAANQSARPGYALVDMTTGYQLDHYGISLYVKNLLDKDYDAIGFLNGTTRVYSQPREIGLQVSYQL